MVRRKTSEPPKRNNNNFAHNESLQIKASGESAPFSHIENLDTSSRKDHFLPGKVDRRPEESALLKKRKKFASLSGNR